MREFKESGRFVRVPFVSFFPQGRKTPLPSAASGPFAFSIDGVFVNDGKSKLFLFNFHGLKFFLSSKC